MDGSLVVMGLDFKRSWVQIPEPHTWCIIFHICLLYWCLKRTKINVEEVLWWSISKATLGRYLSIRCFYLKLQTSGVRCTNGTFIQLLASSLVLLLSVVLKIFLSCLKMTFFHRHYWFLLRNRFFPPKSHSLSLLQASARILTLKSSPNQCELFSVLSLSFVTT